MPTPTTRARATPRHGLRADRGSVSVWFALAAVAIVLCVGIAVDLSGDVHARQRAHDIAAQAARAAGEQVAPAPAVRGHTPTVDPLTAQQAAETYLTHAGVTGTVTITADTVIHVTVHDSYTPMFLTMLGVTHLTVTGHSTARLERVVQGVGR